MIQGVSIIRFVHFYICTVQPSTQAVEPYACNTSMMHVYSGCTGGFSMMVSTRFDDQHLKTIPQVILKLFLIEINRDGLMNTYLERS